MAKMAIQERSVAQFMEPGGETASEVAPAQPTLGTGVHQAYEISSLLSKDAPAPPGSMHGNSAGLQAAEVRSSGAVQMSGGDQDLGTIARSGFAGQEGELPYRDRLERTFGVNLSGVKAYTGSAADRAARKLGGVAYAHEGAVVLGNQGTDFRTVAEETSHVLQMRRSSGDRRGAHLAARGSNPEREARVSAVRATAGMEVGGVQASMAPDAIALSEGSNVGEDGARLFKKEHKSWWEKNSKTIIQSGIAAAITVALGGLFHMSVVATIPLGAIVGGIVGGVGAYMEPPEKDAKDQSKWGKVLKGSLIGAFAGALGVVAAAVSWIPGIGHGVTYFAAKWAGKTAVEAVTEHVIHHWTHNKKGHKKQADVVAAFEQAVADAGKDQAVETLDAQAEALAEIEAEAQKRLEKMQEYMERFGGPAAYERTGPVPRFG